MKIFVAKMLLQLDKPKNTVTFVALYEQIPTENLHSGKVSICQRGLAKIKRQYRCNQTSKQIIRVG
jgi:hypothetical protein